MSIFFRDAEDDADFDATTHLVRVPKKQEIKGKTSSATISIEGMTCQGCVNNIQGYVGKQTGVLEVKVLLQEKTGYVLYNVDETTADEIVEIINNMGFDALLTSGEEIKADNLTRDISKCSIHIDGMTCNSCVNNITGKL